MIIEKVYLTDRIDHADGRQAATVLFEHEAGTLTLKATVNGTHEATRTEIDQSLAAEAIRQLRRMPEFRHDASLVIVLDSAWPGRPAS